MQKFVPIAEAFTSNVEGPLLLSSNGILVSNAKTLTVENGSAATSQFQSIKSPDMSESSKPYEWKEVDPLGKSSHELGAKLDAGKPCVFRGLLDYFPRACIAVADVSTRGAKKYAWKGWEKVPDGIDRYADAQARHIVKESIEGLFDIGPGGLGPEVLHQAQNAWNALARLELILRKLEKEKSGG
jgi:hypothetical protein